MPAPVRVRDQVITYCNTASSLSAALPAATVAGDLLLAFVGHDWDVSTPSGWTTLDNQTGSFTNGAVFYKTATSGDVAAGNVSISFAGTGSGEAAVLALLFSSPVSFSKAMQRSSGGATSVVVTSGTFLAGALGLYFGMNRAGSSATTFSRGTLLTSRTADANESAGVAAEDLATAGTVPVTVTHGSAGSGYYDGIVTVFAASAAALSSGSTLTGGALVSGLGVAALAQTSTMVTTGEITLHQANTVLQTTSHLTAAPVVSIAGAAALTSASTLDATAEVGQASAALLSVSTLGSAGATVRPALIALRSTSALGATGAVPPTGVAALHATSALGALATIAGQVTALAATWTVAPLSIAYDASLSSNVLTGGNAATGGALTLRVVISAATLEQAVLPDWLPGTIVPGTVIDPGGPGVAATYTDPVFIPEDFGVIVNTPGVPPAPVPLGSQFVPLKRVSAIYPVPTLDSRGRPINWQPSNVVISDIGWYQVIVGGRDCTVLGGIPAQITSMVKHEPFGYATATVTWPGVSGFQSIGPGAPYPRSLFKAGAAVEIRIIDPLVSLTAYHTVFEGELSSLDDDNDNKTDPMSWTIIGVLFRADLQLEAPRIIPITTLDIGTAIPRLLNAVVNRTYAAVATVVTKISSYRRGSWQPILTGAVQDILSTATTADGLSQWTVMTLPGRKVVMRLKETSAIHWTVRYGQRGVVSRLRLDSTQFANAIFAEGTDPKGNIWRNSKYPNLHIALVPAYPLSPSDVFLPGSSTTGFQPFADFLRRHGYGTMVSQDTYDADDEDEVKRAQWAAQILVDGIVGPQTWVAIFGIGTDAESLSGARIDPLVIDPHVELYTYGGNGSITGANPNLDPHALRVDRFEEMGEGIYKIDGIRSARAEYHRDHIPGYVGTIDLSVDPNEGSRRFIEPGENILLQNHRGVNRKLHIAGVTITEAGSTPAVVSLDVAEKPMDRLTLAGILSRNKDNTDPARRRLLSQRRSRTFDDQIIAWDSESGAGIVPPFPLFGGLWTVVRIPAGGYATIVETLFHTRDVKSEFSVGVFSEKVTAAQLSSIVGNPLRATTGSTPWVSGSKALLDIGWVIAWGDNSQPCGYSPEAKGGGSLTGDLIDKGSWEFQTTSVPWMWLAVYASHSCAFHGQLRAAILQ